MFFKILITTFLWVLGNVVLLLFLAAVLSAWIVAVLLVANGVSFVVWLLP